MTPRAAATILATIALGVGGCVTTDGSPPAQASSASSNPRIPESAASSQLHPLDALTISIQGVPDASTHPTPIDNQGMISLPLIGSIKAAGMTQSELQQAIIKAYIDKKIYTSVSVSVGVTERYVYVSGEVARAGRIIWSPDLTVAKAIMAAGGFGLYAKETAVSVARENTSYTIDVKLAQKNPEEDPKLVPGDSIQVPRSRGF